MKRRRLTAALAAAQQIQARRMLHGSSWLDWSSSSSSSRWWQTLSLQQMHWQMHLHCQKERARTMAAVPCYQVGTRWW